MSRAFVKEDVEITERTSRRRAGSGLPPGALNYITAAGEARLRVQLAELEGSQVRDEEEIASLKDTLSSVTVVQPKPHPESVVFGSLVTLRLRDGREQRYRIVGVDEVEMQPENVSWVSATGRALLGAEVGQRVTLEFASGDRKVATVVAIEQPATF